MASLACVMTYFLAENEKQALEVSSGPELFWSWATSHLVPDYDSVCWYEANFKSLNFLSATPSLTP